MSYPPEPAPGLSELEDRHRLQRQAHSIGYVAVPETVWRNIVELLEEIRQGQGPYNRDPLMHASNTIEAMVSVATAALAKATEADERIRQERE